jgi:hypothetical protein
MARASFGLVLLFVLFACKTERKSKNDDIAACNASGGYWKEGGCNDSGHCEKTTGMAPDDDDEIEMEDEGDDDDDGPNL